jgi:hypothetical protein
VPDGHCCGALLPDESATYQLLMPSQFCTVSGGGGSGGGGGGGGGPVLALVVAMLGVGCCRDALCAAAPRGANACAGAISRVP